ncbi:hypothetical protein BC830DRAFT_1173010 [Chytriomyces sp. MP71]|nr:hypothetical protein BC830DRAFT_1173010 [Chytriomyces sp. MP71]
MKKWFTSLTQGHVVHAAVTSTEPVMNSGHGGAGVADTVASGGALPVTSGEQQHQQEQHGGPQSEPVPRKSTSSAHSEKSAKSAKSARAFARRRRDRRKSEATTNNVSSAASASVAGDSAAPGLEPAAPAFNHHSSEPQQPRSRSRRRSSGSGVQLRRFLAGAKNLLRIGNNQSDPHQATLTAQEPYPEKQYADNIHSPKSPALTNSALTMMERTDSDTTIATPPFVDSVLVAASYPSPLSEGQPLSTTTSESDSDSVPEIEFNRPGVTPSPTSPYQFPISKPSPSLPQHKSLPLPSRQYGDLPQNEPINPVQLRRSSLPPPSTNSPTLLGGFVAVLRRTSVSIAAGGLDGLKMLRQRSTSSTSMASDAGLAPPTMAVVANTVSVPRDKMDGRTSSQDETPPQVHFQLATPDDTISLKYPVSPMQEAESLSPDENLRASASSLPDDETLFSDHRSSKSLSGTSLDKPRSASTPSPTAVQATAVAEREASRMSLEDIPSSRSSSGGEESYVLVDDEMERADVEMKGDKSGDLLVVVHVMAAESNVIAGRVQVDVEEIKGKTADVGKGTVLNFAPGKTAKVVRVTEPVVVLEEQPALQWVEEIAAMTTKSEEYAGNFQDTEVVVEEAPVAASSSTQVEENSSFMPVSLFGDVLLVAPNHESTYSSSPDLDTHVFASAETRESTHIPKPSPLPALETLASTQSSQNEATTASPVRSPITPTQAAIEHALPVLRAMSAELDRALQSPDLQDADLVYGRDEDENEDEDDGDIGLWRKDDSGSTASSASIVEDLFDAISGGTSESARSCGNTLLEHVHGPTDEDIVEEEVTAILTTRGVEEFASQDAEPVSFSGNTLGLAPQVKSYVEVSQAVVEDVVVVVQHRITDEVLATSFSEPAPEPSAAIHDTITKYENDSSATIVISDSDTHEAISLSSSSDEVEVEITITSPPEEPVAADTLSIQTKSDKVAIALQALKTRLTYRPIVDPAEKERLASEVLELARPLFFPIMSTSSAETVIASSHAEVEAGASLSFSRKDFHTVTTVACRLPRHLTYALHNKVCALAKTGSESPTGTPQVSWREFEAFVEGLYRRFNPDLEALAFEILRTKTNGDRILVPEDFRVFVEDVLENNTAFAFLASSPDFQLRFTETVIVRLFYSNHFHGRNRMALRDFRTAQVYKVIAEIESATNSLSLNIPAPFCYKDFYVIYCAFWELDKDHDMYLTLHDLERYSDRGLSHAALARIVECYGRVPDAPESTNEGSEMSTAELLVHNKIKCFGFQEFVAFIMAVEEKASISGLYYWFRVLDIDEDGLVSLLEIETFWEHQYTKVPEQYTVYDFFSLILDLVRPSASSISLLDLKRNPVAAGLFLDFLLDSRRHVENIRRSADVTYRLNDEVWILDETVEDEASATDSDDSMSPVDADSESVAKRIKLEGWQKFVERRYRLLSGAVTEEEEADSE